MRIKSESLFLLSVFGILLFLGFSSLFSHKLIHEFPQGYIANDAFYKYNRAHNLIENSDYKNVEWYTVDGRKDLMQDDMPLSSFMTAQYSIISGIPDFDAYQFVGIFIKMASVFVTYFIIRRLNKNMAIASLAITPFIFIKNNFISFHYGWIPITVAASILIFISWSLINLNLRYIWILLGISVAAVMLSHTSEYWYCVLIIGLFSVYIFFKEKFSMNILKKILLTLIIFIPLIFYYLPINLNFTYNLISTDKTITSFSGPPTFPITVFSDFGVFSYLIILGILASLYYCYKNRDKIIYFIPIYILIAISNLSLLGMHDRFYQLRYFWPVFFMIFFGFGAYYILNIFIKKINDNIKTIVVMAVTLILIFTSIKLYYTSPSPNSLVVNKDMWDGMQWVRNNVPKDSSTLIVHGDSYQQHGIYLMFERVIHQIKEEDYIQKLQSGIVSRNYTIRKFIHSYTAYYVRKGLFTFEPVRLGKPEWEQTRGWEETDLCTFDYYVIDKLSRFQEVINYNMKIRETLLKSGHFEEVFSNGWYSILKNNKPGEDCIGNKTA